MKNTRTKKAEATRRRLLETAVRLFEERGFAATTMRAIAVEAGVSTGLAYRYFDGKEALVAELYAQLTDGFVESVELPDGSWAVRGLVSLDASLAVLAPHRDLLAVLMGSSIAQPVLSPPLAGTAPLVEAVFYRAVAESQRPPSDCEAVAQALYLMHLSVLLFWVLDRSEAQRATVALRAWVSTTLPMLALALRVPGVMAPLRSLLAIIKLGILGREEDA